MGTNASVTSSQLATEFAWLRSVYQGLAEAVVSLIQKALADEEIVVQSITCRVKDQSSFLRKIERPGKEYGSLGDVTDLAGIRIISYFADDVDRIARTIENLFDIEKDDSVDKRELLDPDRFGYLSLHYVAKFGKQRLALVEYKKFASLRFEIQVRSVLQHGWAEIEHDLGYKSAIEIPKAVRRRFARVAGLLELADLEFVGIREQLAEYTKDVAKKIKKKEENVEVDRVTLLSLIKSSKSVHALDDEVVKAARAELVDRSFPDLRRLVIGLHLFGVSTISELESLVSDKKHEVGLFAAYWLQGKKVLQLSRGIGIFYLLYVLAAESGDREKVKTYMKSSKLVSVSQVSLVDKVLDWNKASGWGA